MKKANPSSPLLELNKKKQQCNIQHHNIILYVGAQTQTLYLQSWKILPKAQMNPLFKTQSTKPSLLHRVLCRTKEQVS